MMRSFQTHQMKNKNAKNKKAGNKGAENKKAGNKGAENKKANNKEAENGGVEVGQSMNGRSSSKELLGLRNKIKGKPSQEILRLAINHFGQRICLISSFGAESAILLHMTSRIDPTIPTIFLNTHKLFGETLTYRDRLQEKLGLSDIRTIAPLQENLTTQDKKGDLWHTNPDLCCHIRKVLPQERALKEFDAVITGRKRFQTNSRSKMEVIESDGRGHFRINPLANWSLEKLKAYIEEHQLPQHPLVAQGYDSIGCMPCTTRGVSGNYRTGRWAGRDKEECGIHGEGI